jgi:hypothetical protein
LRAPGQPGRGFEQRAETTWARSFASYEDVPEPYRGPLGSVATVDQSFPYTLLTPAYTTFRTRISEKLICVREREIQVLERNGTVMTVTCYPIHEIRYVEVSSMLLEYRVKIEGITSQGTPASSIFRCSTATDYLFTPVLRKIRLRDVVPQETPGLRDTTLFDGWSRSHYKFMNFARNSLLGGEKVICAVLQPEIKTERFRILGRTYYRIISPTHTCILTDRELILIREEAVQNRKDKYGGIWNYIPLSMISALSINPKNSGLLALSIELSENGVMECLFPASRESEVSQLAMQLRDRASNMQ